MSLTPQDFASKWNPVEVYPTWLDLAQKKFERTLHKTRLVRSWNAKETNIGRQRM